MTRITATRERNTELLKHYIKLYEELRLHSITLSDAFVIACPKYIQIDANDTGELKTYRMKKEKGMFHFHQVIPAEYK